MDFEDFEDKKDALPIGEKTMKVVTTRMSYEDIQTFKDYACQLQYDRKQRERMTFQEGLHQIAILLRESILPAMEKTTAKTIAESLQIEIQPQNIPHEILQTEIPQQTPEPQTLQTASKKIAGMSIEEIQQKAKESVKEPYNDYIAPSKQEKKKDNVIQITSSKKKLFDSIGIKANE